MPEEVKLGKITSDDFSKMISPLKLDLIALFKIIEEDVYKIVDKGQEEGLTPEEIIKEVEKII